LTDSNFTALKAKGTEKERYLSIQVLRGISAVAVAIYHTHLILAQPENGSLNVFSAVASKGWLGVNFFFVLSGFIIMNAHANDISRPDRFGRYLWKRFARVYPIYWIALTLFLLGAAAGLGKAQFQWSALNLGSAYLLTALTDNLTLPLQVAWTLFYEVRFYFAFAVLILNLRLGLCLLGIWFAAILVANIAGLPVGSGALHVWNLYFAVGAAFFWLFKHLNPRLGPYILAVGIPFALVMAALYGGHRVNDVQWNPLVLFALSIPFGVVLLGATLSERYSNRFVPPAFFVFLGEASYSIYLVHSATISVLAVMNVKLMARGFAAPQEVVFVVIAILSILAGSLFHLGVERPVIAIFDRSLRGEVFKFASRSRTRFAEIFR
jgi:exopolysaccharide production protein ExoZ